MGYYEFPHTRNYDTDLGYLIKKYKELLKSYNITNEYLKKLKTIGLADSDVKVFNTCQDMKSIDSDILEINDFVFTNGYYELNDGGLGIYKISAIKPDGFYERISNGLYAELITSEVPNVKQYGAYGDGIHDDTNEVQTAINNNYNKELFIPKGIYKLTETININDAITITGVGCDGKSTLSGNINCGFLTSAPIGFNITRDLQTFSRIILRSFSIKSSNGNGKAIYVQRANHITFDKLNIIQFNHGTGLQLGILTDGFSGQYSLINDCIFGECLIGVDIQNYIGVHIVDSLFDGNNNGTDIGLYTHGYPDGSIAIKLEANQAGSNRIEHCRIQGFEYGVSINSSENIIRDIRAEMTKLLFLVNSDKNIISDSALNNYLILEKNGLPTSGRYGAYCVVNSGNLNCINEFIFGSCYGADVRSSATNTYGSGLPVINITLGNISENTNITNIDFGNFIKGYSCCLKSVKITATNMEAVKSDGGSWYIAANNGYTFTNDSSFVADEDGYYPIVSNNQNLVTSGTITINKNSGTPLDLKNVRVKFIVEPYPDYSIE